MQNPRVEWVDELFATIDDETFPIGIDDEDEECGHPMTPRFEDGPIADDREAVMQDDCGQVSATALIENRAQKAADSNCAEHASDRSSLLVKCGLPAMFVGVLMIAFAWFGDGKRPDHSGTANGSRSTATRRIDQMQVGQAVVANNPTGDVDLAFGETIVPDEWRKLTLRAPKTDGSWSDVVLLRPLVWLESERRTVDGKIHVTIPECGIDGDAELLAVEPCPPIEDVPECRIVTGVFRHHSAEVIDVHVAGIDSPIGATGNHPFWSEDRQDFVRADALRPGERLRSLDDQMIVARTVPRPTAEPVYNIEVHVDHVYHVTAAGILVHNAILRCDKIRHFGSSIRNHPSLARHAEDAGKRVQQGLDHLTKELQRGNLNPGTGSHHLFGDVFEARAKDGARVYFRVTRHEIKQDGKRIVEMTIDVVAKSDKPNQNAVLAILKRLFGN